VPSRARPTHGLLAVLAVAGAVGCAEEPSFQLGWQITTDAAVTDPADAPALASVKQCSEVGIEKLRLEVRGVDDVTGEPLRFTHDYACFPASFGEGEPIDGPTLAPGEYDLELIGLRRSGAEWLCPDGDTEVPCVRDVGSVTVREGELPEVEFLLVAPSQCDDGVDNDRDGRVDGSDPACTLGESMESLDAGLTVFQLSLGILGNSLIEPTHVDIADFALTIDGEPLDTLQPFAGPGLLWPWRFPLLSSRLQAGSHTLGMVAIDASGELTEIQTLDFVVDAEEGAFVIHEFALGSADFLAPIEDSLAIAWAMGGSIIAPPCGPISTPIDDMRVRVHEGDAALALAVEDLLIDPNAPLVAASVEPDDWLAFACDNAGRLRSTAPLTWTETGYAIEIEGRIGGVTCFASGSTPLRPGSFSPVSIAVLPVLDDDGLPPAGCPALD
jgi:hypothetical protein